MTDVIIPTVERIEEDVGHLKEWISKEPHLPDIDDAEWLKKMLYQCKFSPEKTKFKLEKYYSLRSKYPEFLKNRDPTGSELSDCRKYVKFAVSEKLLEEKNTWLLFLRYEGDPRGFDAIAYAKRAFMVQDLMLLKQQNRPTNLVTVVDLQDMTYLHALKVMPVVTKMAEILNNAYAARTKATHLINFPTFAHSFLEICRSFYPKKVNDRMHVHSASNSTLFEMVDREDVCRDFGGSGPTLAELEERTQQELEKYRRWFEEQDGVCSDESLRRKDFDIVEEMKGSFRKLEVD